MLQSRRRDQNRRRLHMYLLSRTGNLRTGRHLRKTDNVGMRGLSGKTMGHELLPVQKRLPSTHFINHISNVLAANLFGTSVSHRLAINLNIYILTMASFSFLFAPPGYPASLKLSVLECRIYFRFLYTHATTFILGQCLTF